jgi:hypothetical protein
MRTAQGLIVIVDRRRRPVDAQMSSTSRRAWTSRIKQ